MLKGAFAVLVVIYTGILVAWCFKFPISYKLTNGTSHQIVVDHDLSKKEMNQNEKAFKIRQIINIALLYASVLLFFCSYLVHKTNLFESNIGIKIIMVTSGFFAVFLILVNGMHFIPGPPIR